jgi:YhcH/YjgK/YiaL family protein
MILDSYPQWRRYEPLNARFGRAFAFLAGVTPETALGRHEIDGDAAFALVQRYDTRPVAGMQFEAHRRYIDIQYVVRGREVIHWAPLAALAEVLPYDDGKDVALFAADGPIVPVRLPAEQFMILFPDDAHAPCCVWDEPGEVVKVVVKVAV